MQHDFFTVDRIPGAIPVSALHSPPNILTDSDSAPAEWTSSAAQKAPLTEILPDSDMRVDTQAASTGGQAARSPLPANGTRVRKPTPTASPQKVQEIENGPVIESSPPREPIPHRKGREGHSDRPPIPDPWMERYRSASGKGPASSPPAARPQVPDRPSPPMRRSPASNPGAGINRPRVDSLPTTIAVGDGGNYCPRGTVMEEKRSPGSCREAPRRGARFPGVGGDRTEAQEVGRGGCGSPGTEYGEARPRTAATASPVTPKSGDPLLVPEKMHRNLSQGLRDISLSSGSDSPRSNSSWGAEGVQSPISSADMLVNFITTWIDYSNKYGLGYQLRDGSVGVHFNDSTNIILSSDNHHFEYLYYDRSSDRMTMERTSHTMTSYAPELQKKVTLLKHFRGYMQDNLFRVGIEGGQESRKREEMGREWYISAHPSDPEKAYAYEPEEEPRTKVLDFLTKYLRTKHGVVFRLSNHVVQINLFDHTKLILSDSARTITYIDRSRALVTRPLAAFLLEGSKDVLDRLTYARDVVHQMILKKKGRVEG
ncbi:hypothetical protein BDK51DRAFT_27103 [Blyttiomyces helicus]|uniref:POLO box domain-containing protein n=1 Tax=Blyttiomyces helicus TaxID=388810 RepID=A0A4P9W1W1_9FUNG|nr:hypothetical protein BDK51DRAFT_27103 [Blyttiomyces helicus]|eukprot:RKO84748.1 hypothetical protein BDK51DRAFT_27103 [Blyttiomyces helicus]